METEPHTGFLVDLPEWARGTTQSGPIWSHESSDLDMTLLSWATQEQIVAHVNTEVDVLLIGVAGIGEVTVNGTAYQLSPGQILLIPKHAERSLRCTGERWNYLSVHQRRRGLWPAVGTGRTIP